MDQQGVYSLEDARNLSRVLSLELDEYDELSELPLPQNQPDPQHESFPEHRDFFPHQHRDHLPQEQQHQLNQPESFPQQQPEPFPQNHDSSFPQNHGFPSQQVQDQPESFPQQQEFFPQQQQQEVFPQHRDFPPQQLQNQPESFPPQQQEPFPEHHESFPQHREFLPQHRDFFPQQPQYEQYLYQQQRCQQYQHQQYLEYQQQILEEQRQIPAQAELAMDNASPNFATEPLDELPGTSSPGGTTLTLNRASPSPGPAIARFEDDYSSAFGSGSAASVASADAASHLPAAAEDDDHVDGQNEGLDDDEDEEMTNVSSAGSLSSASSSRSPSPAPAARAAPAPPVSAAAIAAAIAGQTRENYVILAWALRRRVKTNGEYPYQDIVPTTGPAGYAREWAVVRQLPLLRVPVPNRNHKGKGADRFLLNMRQNRLALWLQATGVELEIPGDAAADQRCVQCRKGGGPFAGCVVAAHSDLVPLTKGACACCFYQGNGSRCSLYSKNGPYRYQDANDHPVDPLRAEQEAPPSHDMGLAQKVTSAADLLGRRHRLADVQAQNLIVALAAGGIAAKDEELAAWRGDLDGLAAELALDQHGRVTLEAVVAYLSGVSVVEAWVA